MILSYDSLSSYEKDYIGDSIFYILDNVREQGLNVYVANLTRSDSPLFTVKVLIPGCQPLDDTMRRISKRMFELPQKLGLDYVVRTEDLFDLEIFS